MVSILSVAGYVMRANGGCQTPCLFTLFTLFTLLAYLNYTPQTPNRSPEPSGFS